MPTQGEKKKKGTATYFVRMQRHNDGKPKQTCLSGKVSRGGKCSFFEMRKVHLGGALAKIISLTGGGRGKDKGRVSCLGTTGERGRLTQNPSIDL